MPRPVTVASAGNCYSASARARFVRMNRVRLRPWLFWLLLLALQFGALAHAADADAHQHGGVCAICTALHGGDNAPPPATILFVLTPYHAAAPAVQTVVRPPDQRLRPGLIRAPPTPVII